MRRHPVDANTPYLAGGATLVLLMVLFIGLFSTSILERLALGYTNFATVISAVLVDLTNADREELGARRLAVNDTLTRAAQAKADDMARRGYFAHFDSDGRAPWDWMRDAGYEYKYAGENLAVQFSDSADVVQAWLNSPTHRENLLDNRFTEMGIAVAQGLYEGKPTIFMVQMFGTPLYTFSDGVVAAGAVAPLGTDEAIAATSESTPLAVEKGDGSGEVLASASSSEPKATSSVLAAVPTAKPTQAKPPVAVLGTSEVFTEDSRIHQEVPAAATTSLVTNVESIDASINEVALDTAPVASWWMHLFASPWSSVRYGAALALALFLALTFYSVYCELLQAHHMHGVYAASLYAAFVLVFFAADVVFFRTPDVPMNERVAFVERAETTLAFVRVPGASLDAEQLHSAKRGGSQVAAAASATTSYGGIASRFLLDQKGWVLLVIVLLVAGSGMAWQRYRRGES